MNLRSKKCFMLSIFLTMSHVLTAQTHVEPTSVTRLNECARRDQYQYTPNSRGIPLAYGHYPATDLVCDKQECIDGVVQGEILSPLQAHEYYLKMYQKTRCQWTLADLEPVHDDSNNHIFGGELATTQSEREFRYAQDKRKDQSLKVKDLDLVTFRSHGWSRLGTYRATIEKDHKFYSLFLSKTVHNILLRKALLRKVGYKVPATKHVQRLNIEFPNNEVKKEFVQRLTSQNAGHQDRWILSETDTSVVIQDAVLMEDQEFDYNLAKGYISEDLFQGKRIFDALAIIYEITDVPESINMFAWTFGRIFSNNIMLSFDGAENYDCSLADAMWMAKRLMTLNETDWEEVVKETKLPPSIQILLKEKLKSKRNHLALLLGLDNKNLPFDENISNHDDLKNGEIIKEFYDGFSRRFTIEDPESPLSYGELSSFIKSKAMTIGIDLAVNAFNSINWFSTDMASKITNFKKDLADKTMQSLGTNSLEKLPVKSYAFPSFGGGLILNREVMTGTFLGTDNLIQLVDTIGFSARAGVSAGLTGVYAKTGEVFPTGPGEFDRKLVPIDLSASAGVFYNRTYSHIRPITSVQKALKYPFKNIFVPGVKNKLGNHLSELHHQLYQNLSDEEKIDINKKRTKRIQSIIKKIKHFIKTDSLLLEEIEALLQMIEDQYELLEKNTQSFSELEEVLQKLEGLRAGQLKAYEDLIKEQEICQKKKRRRRQKKCKREIDWNLSIEELSKIYPKAAKVSLSLDTLISVLKNHQDDLKADSNISQRIQKALKSLKDELIVGESFIITDSIGARLTASGGMPLYNVVNLKASLGIQSIVLSRLHFVRASENEIHIYKDLGNINSIEITASVEKFVPILKVNFKTGKGKARVKFFKVSLDPKSYDDENSFKSHLSALGRVMTRGSLNSLNILKKPYVIKHKFKEKAARLGALIFRWNWLKSNTNMSVEAPTGEEIKLHRTMKASTSGRDIENFSKDIVDILIGDIFNTGSSIRLFPSQNPGYTFLGKAKNKIANFDSEIDENNQLTNRQLNLTRIWNGWSLNKRKAKRILRQINEKYQFRFQEEQVLSHTEKIFLYNININFFIYEEGIAHLESLNESQIKEIFKYYQQGTNANTNTESEAELLRFSGYQRFLRLHKKLHRMKEKGNRKRYTNTLIKLAWIIENNINLKGISLALGGSSNLFIMSKIEGFRVSDPNGDQTLFSNSFGRMGREGVDGPIEKVRKMIGASYGEFNINWILERPI